VAKVVHNFGRADDVDRDALRRLAASILRVCEDPSTRKLDGEDGVTVRDAWPYGGVYVLEQLWKEVGVDRRLWSVGANGRVEPGDLPASRAQRLEHVTALRARAHGPAHDLRWKRDGARR
jgi:hypothetical protein